MLPEKRQKQELSTQQKTFIDFLFGEAQGNPKKAGELAGYSEHSYPKVIKSLNEASLFVDVSPSFFEPFSL